MKIESKQPVKEQALFVMAGSNGDTLPMLAVLEIVKEHYNTVVLCPSDMKTRYDNVTYLEYIDSYHEITQGGAQNESII